MSIKKIVITLFVLPVIFWILAFAVKSIIRANKFKEPVIAEGIDQDIILVNVGDGDREYIANVINEINKLQPAVIGIDIMFMQRKNTRKDSILSQSIESSPVVLAVKAPRVGAVEFSDALFSNRAMNNSSISAVVEETITNKFFPIMKLFNYYPIKDAYHGTLEHFGVTIAKKFDSLQTSRFLQHVVPHQSYPIEYTRLGSGFNSYDYQDLNFDPEKIKGKIVLLGYLGPTEEDKHHTPLKMKLLSLSNFNWEPDTYGLVIHANIIRMILNYGTERSSFENTDND